MAHRALKMIAKDYINHAGMFTDPPDLGYDNRRRREGFDDFDDYDETDTDPDQVGKLRLSERE